MDTEQLRYFLAVAQQKNISKAAEHLYIGQPALSRQISRLEDELGVQLFLRTNKAMELTAAGELLLEDAETIIHRLEQLTETMRLAAAGMYGQIHVAVLGNFSSRIQFALRKAIDELPDCNVVLERYEQELLKNAFATGAQDIVLTLGFSLRNLQVGIERIPLEPSRLVYIIPKTHRLYHNKEITPADICTERLILLAVKESPRVVDLLLSQSRLPDGDMAIYTKGIDSLIMRVDTGMGIGIIPQFLANNYTQYHFAQKEIVGFPSQEMIELAWRRDTQNPAIEQFVKAFRRHYREYEITKERQFP